MLPNQHERMKQNVTNQFMNRSIDQSINQIYDMSRPQILLITPICVLFEPEASLEF